MKIKSKTLMKFDMKIIESANANSSRTYLFGKQVKDRNKKKAFAKLSPEGFVKAIFRVNKNGRYYDISFNCNKEKGKYVLKFSNIVFELQDNLKSKEEEKEIIDFCLKSGI